MNIEKLNEITRKACDTVEDFLNVDKYELLDLVASLHNELYKQVTGYYYDYMYHWANLGYGGSPDDAMFKSIKDESTIPVWHPIKLRPLTPEERGQFAEYWGIEYCDTQDEKAFDCLMPEDQERILICTKWGVYIDTCEYDPDEGYSLEDRGDWEDVTAWMSLPEPYKKDGETK